MNYYRFCNYLIILSFMLTIIPILLSYDIRDEIVELIKDLDNQIVVDTSVYNWYNYHRTISQSSANTSLMDGTHESARPVFSL